MKAYLFLLLLLSLFLFDFISAAEKVEINTAPLQQIETLAGIGSVKAQAIINARPFSSLDDLLRVKGIKEKTLQKIKEQGLAYIGGQIEQPPEPEASIVGFNSKAVTQDSAAAYPAGVIINEILPNPEGPDETDEWIELYNENNFDVNLSGWQIKDTKGSIKIYTIPNGFKVAANGFLVLKRTETKIMLNNDQDGLELLKPDKNLADSIIFDSAPLNQSYNNIASGWQWSSTLTPGNKNILTEVLVKNSKETLSKTKISVKNESVVQRLVAKDQNLNQDYGKTENPWFLFFTVLTATIILSASLLFTKLNFLKKHVRT